MSTFYIQYDRRGDGQNKMHLIIIIAYFKCVKVLQLRLIFNYLYILGRESFSSPSPRSCTKTITVNLLRVHDTRICVSFNCSPDILFLLSNIFHRLVLYNISRGTLAYLILNSDRMWRRSSRHHAYCNII